MPGRIPTNEVSTVAVQQDYITHEDEQRAVMCGFSLDTSEAVVELIYYTAF